MKQDLPSSGSQTGVVDVALLLVMSGGVRSGSIYQMWALLVNMTLNTVNVYAIIIVLCISLDKSIIRTRSLRNTHTQETQHLSWETL
jgi:hypothetical protein